MINTVNIVGRLTKDLEVKTMENGNKVVNLNLAVPRSYKNAEGIYDTDFIPVTLWNNIAVNTDKYCKKGDRVAVRGHLQVDSYSKENGEKQKSIKVVAEKVTFLSDREHSKTSIDRDER